MELKDIAAILKKVNNAIIMPHVSADGDGLGSSLALALAMDKLGIGVKVLTEEAVPAVYSFLPGMHLLEVYQPGKEAASLKADSFIREEYDWAIALDTGDKERLGKRAEVFESCKNTINIDHHTTNTMFAVENYVHPEFAAVGEMVYLLLGEMGVPVDKSIATCLYVAVATDTGGFRFSNTTPVTHRISAGLLEAGIPVADISQKIFDVMSREKVKLMGQAIESLEFFADGKIGVITLSNERMAKAGAREEDCDGIVNIARNVRGVEAAVMLRQWGLDEVRVNLRSNAGVDVSVIAYAYSGGGHKKAAGCTVKGTLDEVKKKMVEEIGKQIS